MSNNITPPPELVQQWVAEIWHEGTPVRVSLSDEHIATRAAQWGADQELEACCEWVAVESMAAATELRAARRPNPHGPTDEELRELRRFHQWPIGEFLLFTISRAVLARWGNR